MGYIEVLGYDSHIVLDIPPRFFLQLPDIIKAFYVLKRKHNAASSGKNLFRTFAYLRSSATN